jgi:hypothetical protein
VHEIGDALTHECGWSEHFHQEACSIPSVTIRFASFLAALRLVPSVCDAACSIFD